MFMRTYFLLIILREVSTKDYPTFSCSYPQWNPDGITYENLTRHHMYSYAMFINSNNSIYTVNLDNNQIDRVNIAKDNQIFSTIQTNYRLESGLPFSIFVTNDQSIYLTDLFVINKWILEKQIWQTILSIDDYCFQIFIDMNQTFYCSMFYTHRIVDKYLDDLSTNQTRTVAGNGTEGSTSNMLNTPHGIFVDTKLDLYIADMYNHRIQRFHRDQFDGMTVAGGYQIVIGIKLSLPTSVVLDADKYLYIVDTEQHRIVASGKYGFRCLVGCYGKGSASNQLFSPIMFRFDLHGNFYITDRDNGRVQKFLQNDTCDEPITDSSTTEIYSTDQMEITTGSQSTTAPITSDSTNLLAYSYLLSSFLILIELNKLRTLDMSACQ